MLCMFRLKTVKCSLAEGNFHYSDKVSMYVTCEGNAVSALKSSRLPKIWFRLLITGPPKFLKMLSSNDISVGLKHVIIS